MSPQLLLLLYLLSGCLVGAIIGWLLARLRFRNATLPPHQLAAEYVRKEVHEQIQATADVLREDLKEKETELRSLEKQLSAALRDAQHLQDQLTHQQKNFSKLQAQSQLAFENIANRLLEEKSVRFTAQNKQQLSDVIVPLKEKIKEFEEQVSAKFVQEARDKTALQVQIKHLTELNQQLSSEAKNLTAALKGDNKVQGDWGEYQLELLLQKAGLYKDIHYRTQTSFRDEHTRQKRPDFIIQLPDNKHLIIDSKVSLSAYERYYTCENENERKQHLQAHLGSIRQHVKDLSGKNYQLLYQINSPDYLLLFVPLEPAFTVAVKADQQLFLDALDKNIVLVTTSTLLATMRTVSYIWKQEKQKKHVLEIARQSGMLYDSFVNFVHDLQSIGQRIEQAQSSYDAALRKLQSGKHRGKTLIGRAERIKQLGAKAAKQLPKALLEEE